LFEDSSLDSLLLPRESDGSFLPSIWTHEKAKNLSPVVEMQVFLLEGNYLVRFLAQTRARARRAARKPFFAIHALQTAQ
jgi:hypothetical protein